MKLFDVIFQGASRGLSVFMTTHAAPNTWGTMRDLQVNELPSSAEKV
jgi:hypothetical protein